jgi:hypothetical protein
MNEREKGEAADEEEVEEVRITSSRIIEEEREMLERRMISLSSSESRR